jgi:DNA topoisomerase IB
MRIVADRLGNTPTVAREAYVHPAVIEAFTGVTPPDDRVGRALDDEAATLRLLRSRPGGSAT